MGVYSASVDELAGDAHVSQFDDELGLYSTSGVKWMGKGVKFLPGFC